MRSTSATATPSLRQIPILLGLVLAALMMLVIPSPASAAPTVAASPVASAPAALSGVVASGVVVTEAEDDEHPFSFTVRVRHEGEPVPGARIIVEGNGFNGEGTTDESGVVRIGVPERAEYTITLDEESLPEGIAVEGEASTQRSIGQQGSTQYAFNLGVGERSTTSFTNQFVERLMNGLNFGLLLGLASLGVSLVFGTTGLTNFAHAEAVTLGAVIAVIFGVWWGMPMWIVLPIVLILGAAAGWFVDAGLWAPLRRRGVGLIPMMIVSIGLSFAVRYLYQFFFGGNTYQLPGAAPPKMPIIGPIRLSWIDIMSMGVSLVLLIAVALWLTRTRIGKATRAISDNPALAAASGINVDRVVRIVWMVATSLAAIAGVLWAYFRPGMRWDMGMQILLLIFAAVVLGGLGTAFGAMIGALIVGLLVELSTLWLPSDLKYVGALAVLIVILLVRPQGLLGQRERIG